MGVNVDPRLLSVGITLVPDMIEFFKKAFKKADPTAVPPTDEEIIAILQSSLKSSLVKDAAWLAAHPKPVE